MSERINWYVSENKRLRDEVERLRTELEIAQQEASDMEANAFRFHAELERLRKIEEAARDFWINEPQARYGERWYALQNALAAPPADERQSQYWLGTNPVGETRDAAPPADE